jgi:cytochrome c-type biogenesis protein CcmH/NrfG
MWRKAVSLDPALAEPWRLLSEVMEGRGQNGEAEALLRTALRLEPRDPSGWCRLGELLTRQSGGGTEAEEAFRRALALSDDDPRPWLGLAVLLEKRLDRLEEAAAAYEKVIELTERESGVWHPLARVLLKLGRQAAAEDAWLRGMRFEPEQAWRWMQPVEDHAEAVLRSAEMETAWRQAVAEDPEFAGPWAGLAGVLADLREEDSAAEDALRMEIALDPNNISLWRRIGDLFKRRDRFEEPAAAYREALSRYPEHPGAEAGLAELLAFRKRRDAEAEEAYGEAEPSRPRKPEREALL